MSTPSKIHPPQRFSYLKLALFGTTALVQIAFYPGDK